MSRKKNFSQYCMTHRDVAFILWQGHVFFLFVSWYHDKLCVYAVHTDILMNRFPVHVCACEEY